MTLIINIGRMVLNIIYAVLKLLPQQKKILFLSRQNNQPSVDIQKLSDEFIKYHPDYISIILCKKLEGNIFNKLGYCFHMLKQMYHLATAEIVILDSYAILASLLKHRSSLLIVQMWHSVGTMKKFAYSILDKPEGSSSEIAHAMRMHANYDYILCAGEGYKDHLAEGFNFDKDRIITLPLPRVELLKSEDYKRQKREEIFNKYPELKNKKNILYVPTFRKNTDEHENFLRAVKALEASFKQYKTKYNLLIKAHPLSGVNSKYEDFTSFDMLFIADYVISDYSCIIYEAAVLQKPLFFYTYDYEEYINKRDIYMDYPNEIPGNMYSNPDLLFSAIAKEQYNMLVQNKFLSKYVEWTRENITKDIVDFLWEHKKERV